jgi:biopolymer transport protein ExbD
MKRSLLPLLLVALGFSAEAFAASKVSYAPISFVVPGTSSVPVDTSQFLILVVERGFLSHNGSPIPDGGVVSYVNRALKEQGATSVGVHIRQDIRFGEVVQALDELRKTDAKSIGVSMAELAPGKEP